MKKRRIAWLMALLLVLLPVRAKADVIVEPEDGFYRRHAQACESLFRWYQANGEPGYAALLDRPGGQAVANIQNGYELFLTYVYHGDEEWGYTEQDSADEEIACAQKGTVSGWIRLSQLRPVYDSIAFWEEHEQEIIPFSGDLAPLFAAQKVLLWDYPGSPPNGGWLEELDEGFQLADSYTDGEGRLWGRIGYYRGWRDSWVCVSDPENAALPVVAPEQPPLIPAVEPPVPAGYPLFILVALAVGITLFLLHRFWGKPDPQKNKKDGGFHDERGDPPAA